jgi:hypothetical protein
LKQPFDVLLGKGKLDKGKSALAEHVCYTKHEIAWENSKVITTNNRYGQRLCLEAWHINMSNHALNRDDGAYFPEEYMHSLAGDVIPWVFKKPRSLAKKTSQRLRMLRP